MRIHYSKDGAVLYFLDSVAGTLTPNGDALFKLDATVVPSITDGAGSHQNGGVVILLPEEITLSRVGICAGAVNNGLKVSVSTDSLDGLNGNWTVAATGAASKAGVYDEKTVGNLSARWIKIEQLNNGGYLPYNLSSVFLFGTYPTPAFKLCDASGNERDLSGGDFVFDFGSANNSTDVHKIAQFKIKNLSAQTQQYKVSLSALPYSGDSNIPSLMKFSLDGGVTKLTDMFYTTPNVAAGSQSSIITICLDVLKATNPIDGYHYFSLDVEEV